MLPVPIAVTPGSRALPPAVPIRAATVLPIAVSAITTPGATATAPPFPYAADRLPAPARVRTEGVSRARRTTDPAPPVPAVTSAESTSAVVEVASVAETIPPEPAADTPPAPAPATLTPTPKASAPIDCFDVAATDTSPPAPIEESSTAARTVFVTETTFRAAPAVTPTAAELPSVIPSAAPPALESSAERSVAVTVTALSVVTLAALVMAASVSMASRLVLLAPAPASPTAAASPFDTCPVPAIVHDVTAGFAVAVTATLPPVVAIVASSTSACTVPRDASVPISLTATDTPAASDKVLVPTPAARAPATAKMPPASKALTARALDVTDALLRTAAVVCRTTVLSANDPAPTKATGSEPSRLPPEFPERAPLTPTAQALMVPPLTASTVTSPPAHKAVAFSIAAVTSTPSVLTDPAAPAETAALVEAGIATWPDTAVRFVSSLASTATALLADTVDRFAAVPVIVAETTRPVRSFNTSAVERAFCPDNTPLAAIVRMSALSAAVTATRPDSATAGSKPAVTFDELIEAFVAPLMVVMRMAAPAESVDLSLVKAVVAIEPATVRILASLLADTSTDPAGAVTLESSAIVEAWEIPRLVRFTDAAAVRVESAATAPIANDQTAAPPASGILSCLTTGSSAVQAASEGLP